MNLQFMVFILSFSVGLEIKLCVCDFNLDFGTGLHVN